MVDKHLKLIEKAAKQKAQVLCLQELFYGPYFCAEQQEKWYGLTEHIPDGPTTKLMPSVALPCEVSLVCWSRTTSRAPLGKIPEAASS